MRSALRASLILGVLVADSLGACSGSSGGGTTPNGDGGLADSAAPHRASSGSMSASRIGSTGEASTGSLLASSAASTSASGSASTSASGSGSTTSSSATSTLGDAAVDSSVGPADAAPESGSPPADASPDGQSAAAAALDHAHADSAVEAMLLHFWSGSQEYLDATVGATTVTGYWTFAEAWDAVLDAVQRHNGARFTGTLRTFFNAQAAVGWSRPYYDDENWMTLALIRAYDLTGDATYLDEAKTLYADIMSAWDTSCCGAVPGGIWWSTAHTSKVTATNAGAVVSGARLYERTENMAYLTFAQQVYAYWSANMVDPTSFHVYDHIASTGVKNTTWDFTYNEGLMIGAATELVNATSDPTDFTLANEIAGYMLGSETESSSVGTILTDGSNSSCTGDCMQFKGIGARYLAGLYTASPGHPEYLSLLSNSANAAWTLARDPSSGLFGVDWAVPLAPPAQLDATSSAAMTLAVVAELAGDAPPDAPDIYEAEEGVLHSVGLEATHTGFDGWGYVAGWNADGQWVDFLISVPAAGSYDLSFRYSAGAGAASRYLFVNGATAVDNLALPSTASWDAYATTATSTVSLTSGANVVSLIYNSSMGSTGYVNLDRLTIASH